MVEHPVNFNFVDNGCLAILLTISCLFGKGFYGELLPIFQTLSEIDGGEVAFSDLPHRSEKVMKSTLVDDLPELGLPFVQFGLLI